MKLSELIEKYGNKEMEEQEFKALFDIKESNVWLPSYGETFYWVSAFGHIRRSTYKNKATDDDVIIENNPVFKTEEEGEFQAKKNRFLLQMERDFIENSEPIDWEDKKQYKWYVYFDWTSKEVNINYNYLTKSRHLYTTNKEWLERYIKENEEDIRRYYLEV